mgnify:CR=1 FL=1
MHRLANERMIVQFALLVVAGALYATTFTQSFTASDVAQSPMFFPRIILSLWIVLNVIALVQTYLSATPSAPIASWLRIGAVVAAGAVVTRDVAPYTIVAGVPAAPLRDRLPKAVADRLIALGWWDWDHDRLRAALEDFRTLPAEAFLD